MLILLFFVIYFLPINTKRWQKVDTVAKKKVMTEASMREIALAILLLTQEGAKHPVETEDIINFVSKIKGSNEYPKFSIREKIIFDAWDTPLQMHYEDYARYEFISLGPNKQDDHGKSDDIVKTYDLSDGEIRLIE